MRLFVAVDPPASAVEHLAAVVAGLEVSRANAPGASTRLTPPSRWHVTVAFLGDVEPDRVDAAASAVDQACARAAGSATPRLRFTGGGTFGRGRSTILWAGLAGDVFALRVLATTLRKELRRARLPFDEKRFSPHLTIARPGDRVSRAQVEADVATLDGYVGPEWSAGEAILMRSEFLNTPTGVQPEYTRLHAAPLA